MLFNYKGFKSLIFETCSQKMEQEYAVPWRRIHIHRSPTQFPFLVYGGASSPPLTRISPSHETEKNISFLDIDHFLWYHILPKFLAKICSVRLFIFCSFHVILLFYIYFSMKIGFTCFLNCKCNANCILKYHNASS